MAMDSSSQPTCTRLTGDVGRGTCPRDRLHPQVDQFVDGLRGFLSQIEVSQSMLHEDDKPCTLADLLDADGLAP